MDSNTHNHLGSSYSSSILNIHSLGDWTQQIDSNTHILGDWPQQLEFNTKSLGEWPEQLDSNTHTHTHTHTDLATCQSRWILTHTLTWRLDTVARF